MITIYGVYRSRASRVLWLLEELKLPFTLRPVIQAYRLPDPAAPDAPFNTRSPEFRKLTPIGAVPVMVDDGLVLTESLAITLHLARKAGGPLAPANDRELALMEQWALFGATWIETPALDLSFVHRRGEQDTGAGRQQIGDSRRALERPLAALEAHLENHSHMVGGRFTVADINMAEIVRYAQDDAELIARHPRLKSWLDLCQARPSFRRMWALREAEPA